MIAICMHCKTVIGTRGTQEGETHGICDPCMEEHHPVEAAKVKLYRTCATCPDKSLKCGAVACTELSARLDAIDSELKIREGRA